MKNQRSLVVAASGYETRIETFEGREHLVVPVVALVEGVMFAMNAPNPELVKAEEFARAPQGWNGRPIFEGHPMVNGQPVSGNLPEVLETKRVGMIFNSGIKKDKLVMEAWLDIEACTARAPELLRRIEAGEDIEISVGVFVDKDDSTGVYAGKKYIGAWTDIVPDHLALLVEGDEGACSRKAGCGVRAAKGAAVSKPKDSLFSRVMSMFRGAQPASEMSNRDLENKLRDVLRPFEPTLDWVVAYYPVASPNRVVYSVYVPGVAPDYLSSCVMYERAFTLAENGEITINDARVEVEPVTYYLPVLMNEAVSEPPGGGVELFPPVADRPNETNPWMLDLAGRRHNGNDEKMIQAMHDHAVALGAVCAPTAASHSQLEDAGASTAGSSIEAPAVQEINVKLEDVLAFLGSASDCDKKALRSALGVTETPAPAPVVAETKPATFEEVLALASPDVKAQFTEQTRVAGEKKAATIKALKDSGRCNFSDEQLNAFDQKQLDNLAALAAVAAPKVDFSAAAPRVNNESERIAPPPSMADAIRAARATK